MENQKRLIDANALMELARNHVGGTVDCNDIARFPTVDAEEVVRCKDCKKWGGVVYSGRCKQWSAPLSSTTHFTFADDFCSCGERKDNG